MAAADERRGFPGRHFSLANAKSSGDEGNVAVLLRRVADHIDSLGDVQVMDVSLHNEISADGDWYSVTVYFDDTPHTG